MKLKTTFNWTKVELKPSILLEVPLVMSSFNWSKVELKQGKYPQYAGRYGSFNWTKVELKLNCDGYLLPLYDLLIELR